MTKDKAHKSLGQSNFWDVTKGKWPWMPVIRLTDRAGSWPTLTPLFPVNFSSPHKKKPLHFRHCVRHFLFWTLHFRWLATPLEGNPAQVATVTLRGADSEKGEWLRQLRFSCHQGKNPRSGAIRELALDNRHQGRGNATFLLYFGAQTRHAIEGS